MLGGMERPAVFKRKAETFAWLVAKGRFRPGLPGLFPISKGNYLLRELRVAIIGCGKIADQHAQQIRRVEGSRIVAVCDREKLMADQLADRFQVEGSFDDVGLLLREARPDV